MHRKSDTELKDKIEGILTAPTASRRGRDGRQNDLEILPILRNGSQGFGFFSASALNVQMRKRHWRSPSNPIDFRTGIVAVKELEGIEEIKKFSDNKTHIKQGIRMIKTPNTFSKLTLFTTVNQHSQSLSSSSSSRSTATTATTTTATQTTIATAAAATATIPNSNNINNNKIKVEFGNKMTLMETSQKESSQRIIAEHSFKLHSYETQLLQKPTCSIFQMNAELSISPIVSSGNSSDYTSTRRHVFKFESAYCHDNNDGRSPSTFHSTSLAHGQINAVGKVCFSRCSLVQLILRNPEDNSVAGIFVVKLDLSDMPANSKTILRQKAYKSKCLELGVGDGAGGTGGICDSAPDYLAKLIELPLKRIYDSDVKRQRILLSGPIRVAFSFNRSNLRYTSPRRSDASAVEPVQKTRTILQFPSSTQKYFSIETSTTTTNESSSTTNSPANNNIMRANSLNSDSRDTRTFQHGSLCI